MREPVDPRSRAPARSPDKPDPPDAVSATDDVRLATAQSAADAPAAPDPRAALLAARAQAARELDDTKIEGPGQMTYGSQAAAASHVFEQQRDLALREHLEQHIRAIDSALGRLDAGSYGRCESCRRPIAPARLEALPWAALCIDCQRTAARRR